MTQRIALVTGAAKGIGLATSQRLIAPKPLRLK